MQFVLAGLSKAQVEMADIETTAKVATERHASQRLESQKVSYRRARTRGLCDVSLRMLPLPVEI